MPKSSKKGKKAGDSPTTSSAPTPEPIEPLAESETIETPHPLDELPRVWKLPVGDQKAEIGKILGIEHEPVHYGPRHIKLDNAVAHLRFARDSGFTLEQTKCFFAIMNEVHSMLEDDMNTVESIYKHFKTAILVANAEESSKDDGENRFTANNIVQIRDYMMEGILGHINLYRAVYSQGEFQEATVEVPEPLVIQTLLADGLRLHDAKPLEQVCREKEEEKKKREEEIRLKSEAEEAERVRLEAELEEKKRLEAEEEARRAATPIRQIKPEYGEYIKENMTYFGNDIGQTINQKMGDVEKQILQAETLREGS